MLAIVAAIATVIASFLMFGFGKKRFDPAGQVSRVAAEGAGS